MVRSSDFLRAPERATALSTLIHQRRLTPSCGGHVPTAERTVGPARMIVESLTPRPGIREQNRSTTTFRRQERYVRCSLDLSHQTSRSPRRNVQQRPFSLPRAPRRERRCSLSHRARRASNFSDWWRVPLAGERARLWTVEAHRQIEWPLRRGKPVSLFVRPWTLVLEV